MRIAINQLGKLPYAVAFSLPRRPLWQKAQGWLWAEAAHGLIPSLLQWPGSLVLLMVQAGEASRWHQTDENEKEAFTGLHY